MSDNTKIRLQKVVRQGRSPMNPKVRWAQLECGHDVYISPGKRIAKVMPCEKCTAELNRTAAYSDDMTQDCGFSSTIGTVTFNKDFWK